MTLSFDSFFLFSLFFTLLNTVVSNTERKVFFFGVLEIGYS